MWRCLAVLLALARVVSAQTSREDFLGNPLPDRAINRLGMPSSRRNMDLTWTADGSAVVLSREDGIVATFARKPLAMTAAVQVSTKPLRAKALSSDGRRFAVALSPHGIEVWDVAGRKRLCAFEDGADGMALSPDGSLLCSMTGSRDAVVRTIPEGKVQIELKHVENGCGGGRPAMAFTPDGKRLIWAAAPQMVLMTSLPGGEELARAEFGGFDGQLLISPDGKLLASTDRQHLGLRSLADLSPALAIEGSDSWSSGQAAWSPDGGRIAWSNKGLQVYDATSGASLGEFPAAGDVHALAWSRDGRFLATASDETLRIWDVDGRRETGRISHAGEIVQGLAYSPDGLTIAVADQNFSVELYDAESGLATGSLDWKGGCPLFVDWSPDGKWILSGGYNPNVRVQDAATKEEIYSLPYLKSPAAAVWGPDSAEVFICDKDHGAFIVELKTGRERLKLDSSATAPLAWSADGRLLACGNSERSAAIRDATTGEKLFTLTGHLEQIRSIDFSPDSSLLATGSGDRTIRLWDTATGALKGTLRGHTRDIGDLRFSPDSRTLFSGAYDGTARMWEIATKAEAARFNSGAAWCTAIAVSRDGRRLALGTGIGTTIQFAVWEKGASGAAPSPEDVAALDAASAKEAFDAARRLASCGDSAVKALQESCGEKASALRLGRTLSALEGIRTKVAMEAARAIGNIREDAAGAASARATVERLRLALGEPK